MGLGNSFFNFIGIMGVTVDDKNRVAIPKRIIHDPVSTLEQEFNEGKYEVKKGWIYFHNRKIIQLTSGEEKSRLEQIIDNLARTFYIRTVKVQYTYNGKKDIAFLLRAENKIAYCQSKVLDEKSKRDEGYQQKGLANDFVSDLHTALDVRMLDKYCRFSLSNTELLKEIEEKKDRSIHVIGRDARLYFMRSKAYHSFLRSSEYGSLLESPITL